MIFTCDIQINIYSFLFSQKEKGQEDDQHNNERRPVAIVPPTFKRSENTLTIKDDTCEDLF